MEAKNYLIGGIVSRDVLAKLAPFFALSSDVDYQGTINTMSTFLLARGNHFICREDAKHLFVVAGHICYSGKEAVGLETLEELEEYYVTNSRFPIEHLEGSFAVILLDKLKATITIYRNILGLPPIYYSQTQKGIVFSDSLSFLAQMISEIQQGQLKFSRSQLPAQLMFGTVSGRNTLFEGILRILPGEQVVFSRNSLNFLQLQTFDSMIGPTVNNCVEYLERIMQKIVNEYASLYPQIGNFFSGGVDSSYIQAHLIDCLGCNLPTFSVDLIHPSWRKEHEYAKSGSEIFKSRHTFVKVNPVIYPRLLIESTAILGEPIQDAQEAFVPELSRTAVQNTSVCLCGMAADTLFGTHACRLIDISFQINKLIPWNFLRQTMMRITEVLNKTHLSSKQLQTFQECLKLDLVDDSSPTHPFNINQRINFELMSNIVGMKKVTTAMYEKRAVLKQYQVTGSLKERYHSLRLLGAHRTCERFYQLASHAGLKLIFPYIDSRIVKLALSMDAKRRFPFMQTKIVLKDALEKYVPKELVYRKKSAWGVPIFEWLGSKGVLFQLVERINEYSFLEGKASVVKKTPDWFLWNLLTFELWHKLSIDQNPLS